MVKVILQHDVQDFDAWKPQFDAGEADRQSAGMKAHSVGRVAGKPNTVVVISEWESVQAFQAFAQSAALQEAMKKGGVVGAPTITVVEPA